MKIYDYVCYKYEESLRCQYQRYSNNDIPAFTYHEIMTIYFFAMHHQKLLKMRDINRYAKDYLTSWFSNLNSYQAFNNRINRLSAVMGGLVKFLIEEFKLCDCSQEHSLLDSIPITLCSGKRKVAHQITDKDYCPTKGIYYFGVKFHALGFRRPRKLPHSEQIIIPKVWKNDLTIYKDKWSKLENYTFYGNKIYNNKDFLLIG